MNLTNLFLFLIFLSLSSLFSSDRLKELGLKSSPAEKLYQSAGIKDPSELSLSAYDVYVNAEDLYKSGKYRESAELMGKLWAKYPAGSDVWYRARRPDDHILNIGSPACYYPLLMLQEALDWKLSGSGDSGAKTIQFTVIIPGKTQGLQPRSQSDLDSKKGTMKTVSIHPKITESDFRTVHRILWLFNEYISAITKGRLKVKTKTVYLKDYVLLAGCEKNNCSPSAGYIDSLQKALPPGTMESSDFFWLIWPSLVPDDVKDFQDKGFVTGGMGRFGTAPFWISDDLSHVRKRMQKLGTPYREEEIRTYFSQWLMHEFYHHLFQIYSEFGLEKDSHQWFDRKKWPSDFKGTHEPDYYQEALHRRIFPKGKPLHVTLRHAEPSKEFYSSLSPEMLLGKYEIKKAENGWHKGVIQKSAKGGLEWMNEAGVKWSLFPELNKGILNTDNGNPYYKNGTPEFRTFKIVLKKDENGDVLFQKTGGKNTPVIEGFRFQNDIFYRK